MHSEFRDFVRSQLAEGVSPEVIVEQANALGDWQRNSVPLPDTYVTDMVLADRLGPDVQAALFVWLRQQAALPQQSGESEFDALVRQEMFTGFLRRLCSQPGIDLARPASLQQILAMAQQSPGSVLAQASGAILSVAWKQESLAQWTLGRAAVAEDVSQAVVLDELEAWQREQLARYDQELAKLTAARHAIEAGDRTYVLPWA